MWKKDETPKAPPSTDGKPAERRSREASSSGLSIVGTGLVIDGDISGSEDLRVEGRVLGSVRLERNRVVVGEQGRVEARVEARVVTVEGSVQGDLIGGEQVVVKATGRVDGNIKAPRVGLEEGAQFRGNIDMGGHKQAPPQAAEAELDPEEELAQLQDPDLG